MDYQQLREKYANGIPCPDNFSFPTSCIDKTNPSSLAFHYVSHDFSEETKVTYGELSDLTHRAAVAFDQIGWRKGDRVLVQLGRRVEWWVVIFGLMRLGVVPIPGTSLLVGKDLKKRAEASKAVGFVGDEDSCKTFESISKEVGVPQSRIVEVGTKVSNGRVDFFRGLDKVAKGTKWTKTKHSKNDIAMIYFTSGTTGMPKMVLLEAEYTLGHTITGHWYRLTSNSVFLNLGDLGWAKAAYTTFGALVHGAAIFVLPPPPGTFNPTQLIDALHRYRITTLCAPPTAYRSLCTTESRKRIGMNRPLALEHCTSAGEPINAAVIKTWKDITGISICDGWGQTETVIVVGNFKGVTIRPGSMGLVAPGFEVSVVDSQRELPPGQEGELCVRTDKGTGGQWIFKGYLKEGKIDKREKVVQGKTWYCTGDRGYRDEDGYFWFVGRDDDVITSAGYRIGPFEVESALKEHAAVLESAAVASPDAQRLEIVKAFVILSAEYSHLYGNEEKLRELTAELQKHCREVTAPFKYPREIEYVRELPKTVSGKLQRVELRNLEYERKKDIVKALKSKL
ncbi:acetyl-CoA synthetase-like protein [Meredithblackwellia eburnea MCA 4105]